MKYRRNQNVGLFDKENTLQELLENGNPLPKLKEIIDFEQFRSILEPVFENAGKKSNAGRKPFDPVFMFKFKGGERKRIVQRQPTQEVPQRCTKREQWKLVPIAEPKQRHRR